MSEKLTFKIPETNIVVKIVDKDKIKTVGAGWENRGLLSDLTELELSDIIPATIERRIGGNKHYKNYLTNNSVKTALKSFSSLLGREGIVVYRYPSELKSLKTKPGSLAIQNNLYMLLVRREGEDIVQPQNVQYTLENGLDNTEMINESETKTAVSVDNVSKISNGVLKMLINDPNVTLEEYLVEHQDDNSVMTIRIDIKK